MWSGADARFVTRQGDRGFEMVEGRGATSVLTGAMGTIGEWTPLRPAIEMIQDGWRSLDPVPSWLVVAGAAMHAWRWRVVWRKPDVSHRPLERGSTAHSGDHCQPLSTTSHSEPWHRGRLQGEGIPWQRDIA